MGKNLCWRAARAPGAAGGRGAATTCLGGFSAGIVCRGRRDACGGLSSGLFDDFFDLRAVSAFELEQRFGDDLEFIAICSERFSFAN